MDKVLKYFRYSAKINGKHMPASIRIAPVEDDPNNVRLIVFITAQLFNVSNSHISLNAFL